MTYAVFCILKVEAASSDEAHAAAANVLGTIPDYVVDELEDDPYILKVENAALDGLPEQTIIALREWGEQHDFLDSEAEDSFDRGIGNIQWALAVESAHERSGEPD